MTRAEIIAEITSFYEVVGAAFLTTSSDEHVASNVNNYSIAVYESGASEKSKKPVLEQRYVNFVVIDEDLPGEAAYYITEELTNDVDADITSTGSLDDIHKMYTSEELRGRVQAAIAEASQDVLNEATPSTTLAFDANSGQKEIIVATDTGTIFWEGKTIIIADDNNYEEGIIFNIAGDYITLQDDLTNTYQVSANAVARYSDNVERQQWAVNALLNPDNFTLSMTSLVSLNATIQAAGGLATDNDIQTVVNSYINKLAAASYL
jgi:hypothetical protein